MAAFSSMLRILGLSVQVATLYVMATIVYAFVLLIAIFGKVGCIVSDRLKLLYIDNQTVCQY